MTKLVDESDDAGGRECRAGGRVKTPVDESDAAAEEWRRSWTRAAAVEESSPLTTPMPWRNRGTIFIFYFWLGLADLSDENGSDISLGKGRLRCNEHYWMAEISWIL